MSTSRERAGRQQFPVGRRRHVQVVDAGCGCRPRRPSLLRLPSFLKPSSCQLGGVKAAAAPRSGFSSQYSASTASFSSSSAATRSSTGYSPSSAYSSDHYGRFGYGGGTVAAAAAKSHQEAPLPKPAAAPAKKERRSKKRTTPAKRRPYNYEKMAAAEAEAEVDDVDGGVGVAVEKESSDPRADFRECMVQMIVEMGLCDWDGLRCMLRRLLALNAPRHHAAILTAFAEVCAQLAEAAAAAPAAGGPPAQPSSPPAYQVQQYWG